MTPQAFDLLMAIPSGVGLPVVDLTPDQRAALVELRRHGLVLEPPKSGVLKRSYAGAIAAGTIRPGRAA